VEIPSEGNEPVLHGEPQESRKSLGESSVMSNRVRSPLEAVCQFRTKHMECPIAFMELYEFGDHLATFEHEHCSSCYSPPWTMPETIIPE